MRDPSAPRRARAARAVAAVVASAAVVLVASCGGESPSPPVPGRASVAPDITVIEEASLRPGADVPPPRDAPVLTLTGRIATTNADDALALDPATLDRLGLVRVTVYEPWVRQTLDFQGVWLADLLDLAGAEGSAQSLHVTALDDYQVDLAVPDVRAGGILLATRTGDGRPIPVEEGGPTRIVFVEGVPAGASAEQWIWSLSTIDVR